MILMIESEKLIGTGEENKHELIFLQFFNVRLNMVRQAASIFFSANFLVWQDKKSSFLQKDHNLQTDLQTETTTLQIELS